MLLLRTYTTRWDGPPPDFSISRPCALWESTLRVMVGTNASELEDACSGSRRMMVFRARDWIRISLTGCETFEGLKAGKSLLPSLSIRAARSLFPTWWPICRLQAKLIQISCLVSPPANSYSFWTAFQISPWALMPFMASKHRNLVLE